MRKLSNKYEYNFISVVNFNLALRLLSVSHNNVLFISSSINICAVTIIYCYESKKSRLSIFLITLQLLFTITELKTNEIMIIIIYLVVFTYISKYFNSHSERFYILLTIVLIVSFLVFNIVDFELVFGYIASIAEFVNRYYLFKVLCFTPVYSYFISENEVISIILNFLYK